MLRCIGAFFFVFLLLSLLVHLATMAEIFGTAAIALLLADLVHARGLKNPRHLREPFI